MFGRDGDAAANVAWCGSKAFFYWDPRQENQYSTLAPSQAI